MGDPSGDHRFTTGQILIAGAVVVAGLLIGSGVLGATFISVQNEDDRPRPQVTVTVTPSPTDPGLLHEQNQESTQSQAELELEEALSSAALAQEHHYEEFGTYTNNVADLTLQGFEKSPSVIVVRLSAHDGGYCMEAQHDRLEGTTYSFYSLYGRVTPGTCP